MNDHKGGLLEVKLPMGSRFTRLHKAWNKRRVEFELDAIASVDKISLFLLVSVYDKCKEKVINADKKKKPLWQSWFSPSTAVIFRCRSRTQKYPFTLCENGEPVLHLAGESETETQAWMAALRNMLWPPSPMLRLEKTLGNVFETSIIDNEFTHRAGLLGAYGHLTISSTKVALSHSQTGDIIQEWYLNTVSFKLLPQLKEIDQNKIIAMITDSKSSTGYGNIIMFCENASDIIERVHGVRKMFNEPSTYGQQVAETLKEAFENCDEHYQVPRRDGKKIEIFDPPQFSFHRPLSDSFLLSAEMQNGSGEDSTSMEGRTKISGHRRNETPRIFGWKNIQNIPASMLDSSMTSSMFKRSVSESGSEDGFSSIDLVSVDSLIEEDVVYENLSGLVEDEEEIPPPLPPKRHSAFSMIGHLNATQKIKDPKSDIQTLSTRNRRRNTIGSDCIYKTKDPRLQPLIKALETFSVKEQNFAVYIRALLTATNPILSSTECRSLKLGRRRASSDYCPMNESKMRSEDQYVDMKRGPH